MLLHNNLMHKQTHIEAIKLEINNNKTYNYAYILIGFL